MKAYLTRMLDTDHKAVDPARYDALPGSALVNVEMVRKAILPAVAEVLRPLVKQIDHLEREVRLLKLQERGRRNREDIETWPRLPTPTTCWRE
jgi:hypothetical protein